MKCAALAIEREVAGAEIRNCLDDRGIGFLHNAPPWVEGRLSSFRELSLPAVYSFSANLSCRNSRLKNASLNDVPFYVLDARRSLPVSSKPPNSDPSYEILYVGQFRIVSVHTPRTGGSHKKPGEDLMNTIPAGLYLSSRHEPQRVPATRNYSFFSTSSFSGLAFFSIGLRGRSGVLASGAARSGRSCPRSTRGSCGPSVLRPASGPRREP